MRGTNHIKGTRNLTVAYGGIKMLLFGMHDSILQLLWSFQLRSNRGWNLRLGQSKRLNSGNLSNKMFLNRVFWQVVSTRRILQLVDYRLGGMACILRTRFLGKCPAAACSFFGTACELLVEFVVEYRIFSTSYIWRGCRKNWRFFNSTTCILQICRKCCRIHVDYNLPEHSNICFMTI
jgi:hypothetical protein